MVTVRSMYEPMATSGHNGNNETFIGLSSALSFSLAFESNSNRDVSQIKTPLELWIQRELNTSAVLTFQYVNATNLTNLSYMLFNSFQIKSTNSSLQIHLKPLNSTLSYLILVKLGSLPSLNSTHADYDFMKFLCPQTSNYFSL